MVYYPLDPGDLWEKRQMEKIEFSDGRAAGFKAKLREDQAEIRTSHTISLGFKPVEEKTYSLFQRIMDEQHKEWWRIQTPTFKEGYSCGYTNS